MPAPHPLTPLLAPGSVAIFGASNDPTRISGRSLRYYREAGYQGGLYPINPTRDTVQGLMAYVEDGLWLKLAQASNAAAARIAAGIANLPGLRLLAPVDANELFLEIPGEVMDALERDGFQFYRRSATLARFVCRFDLTDAEADGLVASLRRHCAAPARAAE